ncbi:hypothetical protein F5B19DRAFT_494926 [Rostrohypoxylon terebratum]|nr:hypothetical protein F5B19DRAFT_494926 [Rostrohypoxylon terebratum]
MAAVPHVSKLQSYGQIYNEHGCRFCIQEPRCRLCSFGLKNGDSIKISADYYDGMPELVHRPFQFYYGKLEWGDRTGNYRNNDEDDDHAEDNNSDDDYGDGYGSDDDASLVDSEAGIITRFAICCCCEDFCSGRRAAVHCFHFDCWMFLKNKFGTAEIPASFMHATHFSYFPVAWEMLEEERTNRIRPLLAENLKNEKWPVTLPNEIQHMIAGNMIRECAIVTAGEKYFIPESFCSTVNLWLDVYAEYTMVEGIRYLKTIGNTRGHGRSLIYRGQTFKNVHEVYYLDDHQGVRDVFITDKDRHLPNATPIPFGTWVNKISDPDGIWDIFVGTDGFKVRTIYHAYNGNASRAMEAQQIARFPNFQVSPVVVLDIRTLKLNSLGFRRGNFRIFPRMDSFDCNDPDVIGYSAAIGRNGIPMAIYSHRSQSDFSMYRELNSLIPIQWVYMPIDQGELVTEICRFMSHPLLGERDSFGLTFTTNRGRTGVLGEDSTLKLDVVDLQRVHEPAPGPSKIFFDKATSMNLLAFENVKPFVKRDIPNSVKPVNPEADSNTTPYPFFYSRCKMGAVTRVTPCYRHHPHSNQLMGMLLEYEDGHTERMGEWRFDWAVEPINVEKKSRLRLTMEVCHGQIDGCKTHSCVVLHAEVVPLGTPLERGNHTWYMDIPWRGTLEWWFNESTKHCEHTSAIWRSSSRAIARGYVDVYDTDDDEEKKDNWQDWVDWDEVWGTLPWYEDSDDEQLDSEFEDNANSEEASH